LQPYTHHKGGERYGKLTAAIVVSVVAHLRPSERRLV
jgi:hypothetical protein